MREPRIPLLGGWEEDALSRSRCIHGMKPGEPKRWKRKYRRRVRRLWRQRSRYANSDDERT